MRNISENPRVALVAGGVATLLASIPLFLLATRERSAERAAMEAAPPSNIVPLTMETEVPKLASSVPLPEPGTEHALRRRSG